MRPVPNVIWNLFLAVIPVVLAFVIARGARRDRQETGNIRWVLWGPLAFLWLILLPNSCYLLTEWRHYLDTLTVSPLFAQAHQSGDGRLDFFLVTSFYLVYSGAGLLAFFMAVWPLDRLTRVRLGWLGALLRPMIFPLCALGVYLGLMRGRFNSWDLVNGSRLADLLTTTAQVFQHPFLLGLILAFGALLWLCYVLFDIWMDGLAWRLAHRHARRAAALESASLEKASTKKDSSHASV
ncbi:MAG: DUF1361 domain-containing protein [Janthinobacterium lividum]